MYLFRILHNYTMDIICSVGFGLDVNSQKDPENPFVKHGEAFTKFSPASLIFLIGCKSFLNTCPQLRCYCIVVFHKHILLLWGNISADLSLFWANISPYLSQADKMNYVLYFLLLLCQEMPLKLVISRKVVPDFRHGENIHCDREIFLPT